MAIQQKGSLKWPRLVAAVLAVSVSGCSSTMWRARFVKPEAYRQIDPLAPYLKCHTAAGHVFVLTDWRFDREDQIIRGQGLHYDADRKPVGKGKLEVEYGQVALLETNRPESVTTRGHFAVMGVMTGASLVLTTVCLSNPKACFGSCPTFFASDGSREVLQAEAFSSSVARVLEKSDVDALYTARPKSRRFDLLMTNEALETHLVKSVRLLAVPRPAGGRVFCAGDTFYPATRLHAPRACRSKQGDCLRLIRKVDHREYLSPADANDLAAKESMEIRFPRGAGSDERHEGLQTGPRPVDRRVVYFLRDRPAGPLHRQAGRDPGAVSLGGRGNGVLDRAGSPVHRFTRDVSDRQRSDLVAGGNPALGGRRPGQRHRRAARPVPPAVPVGPLSPGNAGFSMTAHLAPACPPL